MVRDTEAAVESTKETMFGNRTTLNIQIQVLLTDVNLKFQERRESDKEP